MLGVIDCYSHKLFTAVVPDQTAATTAIELRKIFIFTGFPSTIVSDNGSHLSTTWFSYCGIYSNFACVLDLVIILNDKD